MPGMTTALREVLAELRYLLGIYAWTMTHPITVVRRNRDQRLPESIRRVGYHWTAACWSLTTLFALAPNPGVAAGALLVTGLGGAGFAIMQTTLVYLASPPEMRSRVLGVLSVCIGVGPIGFLHIGWLADLIGAEAATALTGIEGLLALALTRRWWKAI